MKESIFVKRIQSTPLLNGKQKAYFASRASMYSLEVRQRMIKTLDGYEKQFLHQIDKIRGLEMFEKRKKIYEKIQKAESEHQKEVKNMEVQFDAVIDNL